MKTPLLIVLFLAGTSCGADEFPPGERDGEVRTLADGGFVAWDGERRRWLHPEAFWESFAIRGRGRQWPSGTDYPPYAEVSEHDTFLVQVDGGSCLMYFFHTRWRRANDVWRWGDEFNEYRGCPTVFD